MNKDRFSEIFGCKAFGSSRAEKARGCFSSNMVSNIVLFLNCSFSSGMFQLPTIDNRLLSPIYELKKPFNLWFARRTFKAEE